MRQPTRLRVGALSSFMGKNLFDYLACMCEVKGLKLADSHPHAPSADVEIENVLLAVYDVQLTFGVDFSNVPRQEESLLSNVTHIRHECVPPMQAVVVGLAQKGHLK